MKNALLNYHHLLVVVEAAEPGPKHKRPHQGLHPAQQVDQTRSSKVVKLPADKNMQR
jgi:hypothetical protein